MEHDKQKNEVCRDEHKRQLSHWHSVPYATPPPAWRLCPVTQRAASLARNAETSATSCGVPMRLKGDRLAPKARTSSLLSISVSVNPGESMLTVMLRGPISRERDRTNCSTAALLPR